MPWYFSLAAVFFPIIQLLIIFWIHLTKSYFILLNSHISWVVSMFSLATFIKPEPSLGTRQNNWLIIIRSRDKKKES